MLLERVCSFCDNQVNSLFHLLDYSPHKTVAQVKCKLVQKCKCRGSNLVQCPTIFSKYFWVKFQAKKWQISDYIWGGIRGRDSFYATALSLRIVIPPTKIQFFLIKSAPRQKQGMKTSTCVSIFWQSMSISLIISAHNHEVM